MIWSDIFQKKNGVLGLILVLAVFVFALTVNRRDSERRCSGIKVQVSEPESTRLISEDEVLRWVTRSGMEPLEGKALKDIDLKSLENKVLSSGKVETCEAFIDLNGVLLFKVKPYQAVARVLGGGKMADRYMDKNGRFFPVSEHFTPSVMLLSGSYFQRRKGLESEQNHDLLDFVNRVNKDDFWRAQLSQIEVNQNKEMVMIPLLGDHKIEFGKPENIESKLSRLLAFYKKIMPVEGWDKFKKVSVKFDGQIVCS